MTDREAIIERAARLIDPVAWDRKRWPRAEAWAHERDKAQRESRRKAESVLNAICPGLLDGTAWLAPWEATVDMADYGAMPMVARGKVYAKMYDDLREAWRMMRDAYLDPDGP